MCLVMISGHTSAKPSENCEEQDLLLTGHAPEPHSEVTGRETGRIFRDLGLCLYQGPNGVLRVLWVQSLLVLLKHTSGNWGTR